MAAAASFRRGVGGAAVCGVVAVDMVSWMRGRGEVGQGGYSRLKRSPNGIPARWFKEQINDWKSKNYVRFFWAGKKEIKTRSVCVAVILATVPPLLHAAATSRWQQPAAAQSLAMLVAHVDVDCFLAQVEEVRLGLHGLHGRPLGVRQNIEVASVKTTGPCVWPVQPDPGQRRQGAVPRTGAVYFRVGKTQMLPCCLG